MVKTRRQIQLGEMDSPGGLGHPSYLPPPPIVSSTWKGHEFSERSPVCFPPAASLKRASSTWRIMKEIWAELGYRGLFAGRLTFRGSLLAPWLTAGFLLRLHAQSDQSGPGLRHHDQHLRVWKVFLPEEEPGGSVCVNGKLSTQVCTGRACKLHTQKF